MHTSINTSKNKNGNTVNNGYSFPNYSGLTNPKYVSSSTQLNKTKPSKENIYTFCSDWVEFICSWITPIEINYRDNTNKNLIVEKISVHKNPNYRNLHRIYLNGVEVCTIFSASNNGTHKYNEVSVKVANAMLYTSKWVDNVRCVVNSLNLEFVRMARYDIALDGMELLKIDDVLNKFTKSHTVQINNDAIKVLPLDLNKKELRWTGWSIGCKKSGISARYYDKTAEIKQTGKDYITDFWKVHDIKTERVGRFEVQLNYRKLKKYHIDLNNMELLNDAEFLGTMFQQEVKPWLKFYRVRKKDMLSVRKETAIRRGQEINIIKWNHLPNRVELLEYYVHKPQSDTISARNSISFSLREILKNPNTTSTAQIDTIEQYANKYNLVEYVQWKIRMLFGDEIKSEYAAHLQRFIHSGTKPDDTGNKY